MKTLKSIVWWASIAVWTVIKLPISLTAGLFTYLEKVMLRVSRVIVKMSNDPDCIEGFNLGVDMNSWAFHKLSRDYFYMRIDVKSKDEGLGES